MTEINIVRRAIRVGFMAVLVASCMLVLFTLQAHAQLLPTTKAPTQTDTSGGFRAGPLLPSPGQTSTDARPQDYIENYSEEIATQIATKRLSLPSGREMESREVERGLYGEGSSKASTVALIGDPNIGKTTTMIQYVLDHPDDVVYRVKTENFSQIQSADKNPALAKSARTKALKDIILYLENLTRNTLDKRVVMYIENMNPLVEGSMVEVKPAGAITEAVAEKRELRMVLESSASAFKTVADTSPSFKALATQVEIASPKFDSIMDYLRVNRGLIEGSTKVVLSEPAMNEAARLALRFFNTDPFRKAYELLSHAASTLRDDQNVGGTQTRRLLAQVAKLQLELDSLKQDLAVQANETQSARVIELVQKKDDLEKKIESLRTPDSGSSLEIADLKRELADLTNKLNNTPSSWWQGIIGNKEKDRLNSEIAAKTTTILKLSKLQKEAIDPEGKPAAQVAPKHVQIAAAEYTGLDAATIAMDVREGALRINQIGEELFNMDHLIKRARERIATYLKETELLEDQAIANPTAKKPLRQKPIWSVLVPGRTGTGKTDFAMRLAQKLGMPIVKIHMSTYSQHHEASGLIGARPGFIGHGNDGELTGPVRRTPYILIMLDEIQRADLTVIKTIIYPVLDQGEIKDSEGRTVYFDRAILIAPTNAGEALTSMPREEVIKFLKDNNTHLSDTDMAAMTINELQSEGTRIDLRITYGWEESMVGRFDDVITTNNLTPEVVEKIAQKNVATFAKEIASRKITVKLTSSAMKALIGSFDETAGARSIEAYFKRFVKDPVYEKWGVDEIKQGQAVVIDYTDNHFDYLIRTPGQVAAAERSGASPLSPERIQAEQARRGAGVTQEGPLDPFRSFSEEHLVRDATATILRRVKE